MELKVGDIVTRKRNKNLNFKVTSISCDNIGNKLIKIISLPNMGILEVCSAEQLEKVL